MLPVSMKLVLIDGGGVSPCHTPPSSLRPFLNLFSTLGILPPLTPVRTSLLFVLLFVFTKAFLSVEDSE